MMINTEPARRDLAVFGVVLPVTFAVIGALVAARTGTDAPARIVWAVGAALTAAYLAVPSLRRPLFVGASYTTYPVGWVVSHVLLLAIFVLVVTPIGLLVRALGHDPLNRRLDTTAETYWTPVEQAGDVGRYFQQY